jgi:hypothetical protein
MAGLSASVVLIAILLGVLIVVVFDVFCLLRLAGTAGPAHFVPRSVWAVLIVGTGPVGGLVYLLAQRLRKRSPEPMTMRPRPLPGSNTWYGPARGTKHRRSHGWLEGGHALAVVAIAGAVYLAVAGKILDAEAVAAALVIVVFLKSLPAG